MQRAPSPGPSRESVEERLTAESEDIDAILPIVEARQALLEPSRSRVTSTEKSSVVSAQTKISHAGGIHAVAERGGSEKAKDAAPLRYRKRSLALLLIYLPFVLLPWILQCVMIVQPIGLPSHSIQQGRYSYHRYWQASVFWPAVVRLLDVVAALITLPVVGALLAQAAVVYSQRCRPNQQLSLWQTLALADRTWSDVPGVFAALRGNGTSSWFLWVASALVLISSLQLPLQQVLTSNEVIMVMTCRDQAAIPFDDCYPYNGDSGIIIAVDPEPAFLAQVPQNAVVKQTMDALATTSEYDQQPHLWRDPQGPLDVNMQQNVQDSSPFRFWLGGDPYADDPETDSKPGSTFFVSNMQNNTRTGILREHAMRLNSSTQCCSLTREQFPANCAGAQPLEKSLDDIHNMTIRICVPGDYSTSPWNITRDRQDFTENLYIDVFIPWNSAANDSWYTWSTLSNFTTLCETNTTRAYFELPNYYNNYTAQTLLEEWPDAETLWLDYNDYIEQGETDGFLGSVPTNNDSYYYLDDVYIPQGPDPFDTSNLKTPGPLMTVALALFGNASFFYWANEAVAHKDASIMNHTCKDANFPFQRLDTDSNEFSFGRCDDVIRYHSTIDLAEMEGMIYDWVTIFNHTDLPARGANATSPSNNPATALDIGVFLATEAWLTQAASDQNTFNVRSIYTSPGSPVVRPKRALIATVAISVLIAIQVSSLVALLWYIYTVPTWTPQLNALAIAQMAQSIPDGDLPLLGPIDTKEMEKLQTLDGLVGVIEDDWGKEEGVAVKAENVKLARGAEGIVSKKHAYKKEKSKNRPRQNGQRARLDKSIV